MKVTNEISKNRVLQEDVQRYTKLRESKYGGTDNGKEKTAERNK